MFHAMVATSNISRGGAIAMRGWMEAAELAGVAFGGVVGPVILVSAVIAELVARWEEHASKGVKSADDVKEAWTVANDVLKASLKELGENDTFEGLLGHAKQFTSELHLQESVLRTIQAALDRLEDAKFGAQEEGINLREQQELQGKSGEDAEKVRLKYEVERDQLRGTHDVEKAEREKRQKEAEVIDLENQKKAKQDEIAAASAGVARVHQASTSGATGASLVPSDFEYARDQSVALQEKQRAAIAGEADIATGKVIEPLTDEESAELVSLKYSLPQLQKDQQEKGPQYAEQIERLKKQRKDLEGQAGKEISEAQTADYEVPTHGGPLGDQVKHDEEERAARQDTADSLSAQYQEKLLEIDKQLAALTKTQDGQAATTKALETSAKTFAASSRCRKTTPDRSG